MGRSYLFLLWFLFLLAVCLTAQQQKYYITESQLQSIEASLTKLETDRLNWELQVRNSNLKLEGSERTVESLNKQLEMEREQYSRLMQSFNRYETSQSERAWALTKEVSGLRLETEIYKGKAALRLVVIIALVAAIAGYALIRILRFFKIITI